MTEKISCKRKTRVEKTEIPGRIDWHGLAGKQPIESTRVLEDRERWREMIAYAKWHGVI